MKFNATKYFWEGINQGHISHKFLRVTSIISLFHCPLGGATVILNKITSSKSNLDLSGTNELIYAYHLTKHQNPIYQSYILIIKSMMLMTRFLSPQKLDGKAMELGIEICTWW